MRAEDEKIRIERTRAALLKLGQGMPFGMMQIFDGGPVGEWQVRLVKRLQRESMVTSHANGYHANSIRMVSMLKAAAANTPAIVELLWPERAKDVLKGLARLAPVETSQGIYVPPPQTGLIFDADDAASFHRAVIPWVLAREPGRWCRVKDLLSIVPAGRLFPKGKGIQEQWIMLGQLLSSGARRLQVVDGYIVERRNGPGGTEYRLNRKAAEPATQSVPEPEPEPVPVPVADPTPVHVESPAVTALREHGPTTKRDLQDKIGGKRQIAQQAVDDALEQGLCLFGHLPGHARARVYLQEHLDAIEAAVEETVTEPESTAVANATGDEAVEESQPETVDDVDDYTFKSTTLKYIVIYGQNFIAVAEHFRLLHETTTRLETKLDALLERLEKSA